MFMLEGFPDASLVQVAGNFNNWDSNELVMEKTASGWQLTFQLAPGNYEYKFIVDGRWITDPSNPFTTGSGDYINSCFAFKANHFFTVDMFPDAKELKLTAGAMMGTRCLKRMGNGFSRYISQRVNTFTN
jgi:hypothetical protein